MNPMFLIVATLLSASGQAAEMSLSEGWRMVGTSNEALAASRARAQAAREARLANLGAWMPVVKLEASANQLDRDLVMDLDPIRSAMIELQARDQVSLASLQAALKGSSLTPAQQAGLKDQAVAGMDAALPHFQTTIKEQTHWTAAVSAYQPLFHGGKILQANRQATARQRAAAADTARQLADLQRDFGRLYLQAVVLRRSLALRQEALAAIENHRERAARLVEQGMADRSAQLRADLAAAEAANALADDSAKLSTLGLALAQIAGSPRSISPSESLPDPPAPPDLSEPDVAGHPLLGALAAQREAAGANSRSRAGEFLPEIGAFGRYELHRQALSALDPHWIVGVRGSWTLFRGGTDWRAWRAARAQELEAAAMEREARGLLGVQNSRQILTWRQARTKWGRMASQEALARENHRVAQLRFQQGQGTSLDVVDAWLSLEKATLERLAAAGEAWNAALETAWSEGRVEEFATLWNTRGAR